MLPFVRVDPMGHTTKVRMSGDLRCPAVQCDSKLDRGDWFSRPTESEEGTYTAFKCPKLVVQNSFKPAELSVHLPNNHVIADERHIWVYVADEVAETRAL